MIKELTTIYRGANPSGAVSGIAHVPITRDGAIVGVQVLSRDPISGGSASLSVSRNNVVNNDLEMLMTNASDNASSNPAYIEVVKGDDIVLNLVSGALISPVTFTVYFDDGETVPVEFGVAASDEITPITVGAGKITFRAMLAFTLSDVWASLSTASTAGTPTVNIKKNGVSIFTTKITIDANEKTSKTAATARVLTGAITFAVDDEISIDVDVAGTGATGLKVYFTGTRF